MCMEGEIPFRSAETSGQKLILAKIITAVDYGSLKNGDQENAYAEVNDMFGVARSHASIFQQ